MLHCRYMYICIYVYILSCHKACGISVPQSGIESKESLKPNHWATRGLPTVVLICISLGLMMLNGFSYIYWSFVYHLL